MIQRVVSGGQTGVDRGALDAAIDLGIAHGGWCPRGRRAEDGPIPPHYQLRETETANYAERTERNVVDSDGTLILCRGALQGGTKLTRKLARRHEKPFLVQEVGDLSDLETVRSWLQAEQIATLNVAGPRESNQPGIQQETQTYLRQLLGGPAG